MKEIITESKPFEKLSDETYPVSIIVPVKNEAASIERLIDGLEGQTFQPAEIIITDGGSDDATREIIRRRQKESALKIVLIETEQAFPGKGRNLGMQRAAHSWFACIDAGIVPHRDWLENLVLKAEKNPQAPLIFGNYRPVIDGFFTECAAIAYIPPAEKRGESIVSCLFHKSVWQTVGDFREDLRSGEDILFFREIDKAALTKVFTDKALVEWEIQTSFRKTYRRFKIYSRHGMKAGLFFDWQFGVLRFYAIIILLSALSWFSPFLMIVPFLLFVLRAERRIWGWYYSESLVGKLKKMFNPLRVLMVAAINLTIDIAMFHGLILWLWNDLGSSLPTRGNGKTEADNY